MKFKKYFKPLKLEKKPTEHKSHTHRKFRIHYFLIPLLLFFFFGVSFAQAPAIRSVVLQFTKPKPITQANTQLSPTVQEAIEDQAKQVLKQEQANATLPINLLADSVTQTNVGLLEELFATNTTDKAKVRIKRIDRRIRELQNLLTQDKSDKAINEAVDMIQEIGKETDKVATDPNVITDREVLGLIIEQYNRLQLILQQLEDALPINDYLKIEDARKKYLVVTTTNSINVAPNLETVHNIGIKEVAKVVGDDFAHLKTLEVISDFEQGVKPEAREKLTGLEKQIAIDFEKKMLKLPREVRNRKLQEYIQYSFGDPLVQVHALNRIKDALTDREVILGVDSLKELTMKRLIDRIFEFEDQQSMEPHG